MAFSRERPAKKSCKKISQKGICEVMPTKTTKTRCKSKKLQKKNPQKGDTEATKTTKTGKVFLVLMV